MRNQTAFTTAVLAACLVVFAGVCTAWAGGERETAGGGATAATSAIDPAVRPAEVPSPFGHGRDGAGAAGDRTDAADPAGEPLLDEMLRESFAPALELNGGSGRWAIAGSRAFLINQRYQLFGLNRRTGELEVEIGFDLDWDDPFAGPDRVQGLHDEQGPLLLVVADSSSWSDPGAARVYDAGGSGGLEQLGSFEAVDLTVLDLPQPGLAVVSRRGHAPEIWRMRSQEAVSRLPGWRLRDVDASADAERPRVAMIRGGSGVGTELVVFDVSDPERPARLARTEGVDAEGRVAIDPAGRIVVHTEVAEGGSAATAVVRDAESAERLASIDLGAAAKEWLIARGSAGAVLAVAREESIDLYDLSEPGSPRLVGSPPVRVLSGGRVPPGGWWASDREPYLFALDWQAGQLAVIGLDDAAVATRYRPGDRFSRAVFGVERDGEVEVDLLASPPAAGEPGPAGSLVYWHRLQLGPGGTLTERMAYERVLPRRFESIAAVSGRYLVGYSGDTANALITVDGADGSVIDARHPQLPGSWDRFDGDAPLGVQAAGEYVLVRGTIYCLALYRLVPEEGLEPVYRECPRRLYGAALREDGTVVAASPAGLWVRGPQGREALAPTETAYDRVELSPDGRRALLTYGWFGAWQELSFAVFSLEDPFAPEPLHVSEEVYSSTARLVRGGEAVLATEGTWTYAPRLLDARTGEPLGGPGDVSSKYVYHGPGTEFAQDRFVYWHWTFGRWQSTVYDFSSGTAVRLGETPFEHGEPYYVRREGSDQAYLIGPGDLGIPVQPPTPLWIVEADGRFTPRGAVDAGSLIGMRRGFLAGWALSERRTLAAFRDPELNLAPVAKAGAPQLLECEAGGADVLLDGRGSFDPDSTPGTGDDIAAVRWSVDGSFVGEELVSEAWLGKGSHEVQLELTDRLGAKGIDATAVDVVDTVPPEVSVTLEPAADGASWIADGWRVDAAADDGCDGTLPASRGLVIPKEALAAPYTVTGEPGPPVISLVETAQGFRVLLDGDAGWIEAAWLEGRASGRLPLAVEVRDADGAGSGRGRIANREGVVRLALRSSGPQDPRGEVLLRYRLDAGGRVAEALAAGPGGDHVVDAVAIDGEGLSGRDTQSLRARVEQLCDELPAGARCAPGALP